VDSSDLQNTAALQLAEPDLAIEVRFEVVFAFAAPQVKSRHTAPAARRVSSGLANKFKQV